MVRIPDVKTLAPQAFHFEPVAGTPGSVSAMTVLGDDAFKDVLATTLQQHVAVSVDFLR